MKMHQRILAVVCGLAVMLAMLPVRGAEALPEGMQKVDFTVDGVAREALVYVPKSATEKSTPVVFAFHGHGGTARSAVRSFQMNTLWAEAISVYMQGLNTPGLITDPEGKKPGWQSTPGTQGDCDLKFFDAVLAKLKKDYKVDEKRIYSMGHSNGGGFTYLLWAERGEVLAAVAPSAALIRNRDHLKPKPVMHLAGENDPLVKFAWQKDMMDAVKKINGCEGEGKTWDKQCTEYASTKGTPFVAMIHPGTHAYPKEGPALIVKFFKEHPGTGK